MSEQFKTGDYGRFHFTLKKKRMPERMGFNLVARVIEIDKHFVYLKDNDDSVYMPMKADVDDFSNEL